MRKYSLMLVALFILVIGGSGVYIGTTAQACACGCVKTLLPGEGGRCQCNCSGCNVGEALIKCAECCNGLPDN